MLSNVIGRVIFLFAFNVNPVHFQWENNVTTL